MNGIANHVKIDFILSATPCNGIAFWAEWNLDDSPRNVISSGTISEPVVDEDIQWDMNTRQGVTLFNNRSADPIDYNFQFKPIEGKFSFNILEK